MITVYLNVRSFFGVDVSRPVVYHVGYMNHFCDVPYKRGNQLSIGWGGSLSGYE